MNHHVRSVYATCSIPAQVPCHCICFMIDKSSQFWIRYSRGYIWFHFSPNQSTLEKEQPVEISSGCDSHFRYDHMHNSWRIYHRFQNGRARLSSKHASWLLSPALKTAAYRSSTQRLQQLLKIMFFVFPVWWRCSDAPTTTDMVTSGMRGFHYQQKEGTNNGRDESLTVRYLV